MLCNLVCCIRTTSLELLPHQTHAILDDPSKVNMMFSKVIVPVSMLAGNSLAQSETLPGWSQITMTIGADSTVISVPSSFPDLTGTVVSCPVSPFSSAGKKTPH
jgi:hypothetical protein